MYMQRYRSMFFLCALAVGCLIINTPIAQAASKSIYSSLTCQANGEMLSGELFPTSITNGGCTTDAQIFGNIICNFVAIMNSVLGTVYCGIQAFMLPILGSILTLYVLIFGIQILMGAVQLTAAEVILRLLKIAAVWTFATQASWGIGMIYQFFVGLSIAGIDWTMTSVWHAHANPDPTNSISSLFNVIDANIYGAITNHLMADKAELVTFFLILSTVCMPIFMLAAAWLWLTLNVFVRTLLSFMMGISAIAFLIALSPIFLSFMLFKTTAHFFDAWIKYLISYSLQVIIVFACIAMWMTITLQFTDFFSDLSKVIMPYPKAIYTGAMADVSDTRAICPLTYTTTKKGPQIACVSGFDPNTQSEKLIPPSKIVEDKGFMYYLAYHLITLMIISYAFSALLKNSHEIARELAGPADVAPLGGGTIGSGFGSIRNTLNSAREKVAAYSPTANRKASSGSDNDGSNIISKIAGMIGIRKPLE